MYTEQTKECFTNRRPGTHVPALSLVETLASLAIFSVLLLVMMQSFNSILLGSYLIDARTSVRTEGEFVSQFFELYARNADPRTLIALNTANTNICNNLALQPGKFPQKSITWQPLGSGETYSFFYEVADQATGRGRFSFTQKVPGSTNTTKSVLTYGDVNVKDVIMSCDTATDSLSGQSITTITVQFKLDSTLKLGGRPAVRDVQRYITVVVR